MSLIVLIGAQAVGKMTVGKALEKQLDAKLLFNHQPLTYLQTILGTRNVRFNCLIPLERNFFMPLSKIQPQIQQKTLFLQW